MNYNNCYYHNPINHAITSNAKYIAPNSDVYQKQYTNMLLYPGHTGVLPAIVDKAALGPEAIKSFVANSQQLPSYINNLLPKQKNDIYIPPKDKYKKRCNTCHNV